MNHLCDVLKMNDADSKSSDLFLGFRCFTNDVILSFCFARNVGAISAPGFRAPIIEAMDVSLPVFLVFRNFPSIRRLVLSLPPWISVWLSPAAAGLLQVRQMLTAQVTEVMTNPKLLEDAPHPIIYHELLKPKKNGGGIPSAVSLCEEAETLAFAGSDTVGNALMIGTFHTLENPAVLSKVTEEVLQAWPVLTECPTFERLEKLPFLVTSPIAQMWDQR